MCLTASFGGDSEVALPLRRARAHVAGLLEVAATGRLGAGGRHRTGGEWGKGDVR